MNTQLKREIFNRFKGMLPSNINDKAIKMVVEESYERISRSMYNTTPKFLLDNSVRLEIQDEFYGGDIHLYTEDKYGLSWVFDKTTGELIAT